jgi:DNA-binding CsgD family transcriptional regulator
MDLAQALAVAAEVAIVGEGRDAEGRELLRRARAALPPDAPAGRHAWLDLVWSWACTSDQETLSDAELLAVVEAIPREPARFRWWACQDAAEALFRAGRTDEAEAYVRELLEMAEGDEGAMANAMRFQARLERDRGHWLDAVDIARDSVRRADRSGGFLYRVRCRGSLCWLLYDIGDVPGAAETLAQAVTILGGDRPGPVIGEWADSACNLSELLLDLGRWQDAHVTADTVLDAENVRGNSHGWARRVQLLVCARRGTDFRKGSSPAGDRLSGTGRSYFLFDELVEAELRRCTGDLAGARAAIRPALEQEPPIRSVLMTVRALALAAAIEADGVSEAGSEGFEDGDRCAVRVTQLLEALPRVGPIDAAFVSTARAHLARRDAADSPEMWADVVEHWRVAGTPFELGHALLRLGECAARAGDPDQARDAFEESIRIADDLGAAPLAEATAAAARRTRVRLSTFGRGSPDAFGLTTRELEVLQLLAEGATNGAIAQQLFMSPKTASVHVSHVIAKLGVATRTQAAAVAHRNGLVAEPKPGEP